MTIPIPIGPTATDLKIKELAQSAAAPVSRSSEQFMSDIQKTIKDGTYTTQDEAIKGVLTYASSKGVNYEGVDTKTILGQLDTKIKEEADTGIGTKIAESFKGGIERIGEAGVGLAEGKYTIPEAFVRGAAGSLQSFFSPVSGLIGEGIEESVQAMSDDFKQNVMEKATPTIQGVVQWYQGQSPEQQRRLDNVGVGLEVLLEMVGGNLVKKPLKEIGEEAIAGTKRVAQQGLKTTKEGIETGLEKTKGLVGDIGKKTDDDLLKKLNLETEKGKIGDIEVDIPKVDKTLTEKVVSPWLEKDTKVLAGRAVSPRTTGKNYKQKLSSIADVEKNTKKFYENVRTGVLDGNIDTLENASQTIVSNLDTIGARIGEAVKKVDGYINVDNNLTDDIINALNSKGAEVSPATPILKKLFDSLGDGKLTIADAYELKKGYSNEVTKLFKAGDAGTKQYKALSDTVKYLNKNIDDIIETKLGSEFIKDKELYGGLRTIVDDMVASTLVEGRRAPNGLAEQIGMVESIFNPVSSVKSKLITTIGEQNKRGGAWKALMQKYDEQAINAFNK